MNRVLLARPLAVATGALSAVAALGMLLASNGPASAQAGAGDASQQTSDACSPVQPLTPAQIYAFEVQIPGNAHPSC
jgi:hypothetical protein